MTAYFAIRTKWRSTKAGQLLPVALDPLIAAFCHSEDFPVHAAIVADSLDRLGTAGAPKPSTPDHIGAPLPMDG
jgi:hypothetical protein